ncbi:PHP domain-containing protein [Desulfonema magnum]|uniref:PHP domain-containing protein n=1 Tax=Desulfonema magnum TaxID=45655 RepID=A0A975GRQ2_9BACT|nr:PHP domain-containing protein [Desulfonema magnum]QTA91152.1 PHP domain-containing protein [Desulfonema magnum]
MMLFDLHVHTTISICSQLKIDDILKHAKHRGLDGVCITDHQTMNIRHHIREGIQNDGLCILFGMEYTTDDGDFLIFGPFEDIAEDLSATELLRQVKQLGGAAIAAHPFRKNRAVQEYVIREGLCDIVESVNGRNTDAENHRVDSWRQKYFLTESGGSDAHSLNELGKVRTGFAMPVRSRADLIFALKNGLCYPQQNMPDNIFWKNAACSPEYHAPLF